MCRCISDIKVLVVLEKSHALKTHKKHTKKMKKDEENNHEGGEDKRREKRLKEGRTKMMMGRIKGSEVIQEGEDKDLICKWGSAKTGK